jgi:hypothetical protein
MDSIYMPDVSAAIDRLNLPSDEEARLDMLHDYFPDHLIQVNDTSTHCHVSLQRSNYDYCEDLGVGLGWLGVNRDDVRNFYVSGPQSFLCLLESWIPYGWSMFLANNDYRPQSIAVIHFDDHTDMMSPKIGLYKTGWKDMLTHSAVDMCAPETMKQAVLSGAITLGSMMTPLLHHFDRIDVFHLTYGRSRAFRIIDRTTIADDLLDPGLRRMAVDISSCGTSAQRDASRYLRTPEIAEIVNAIHPTMDIFLHIDMDYFNNRYNGSDEWKYNPARHDQPLELQKEEMTRICESLVGAGLVERIRHVSIGISPSFYPSEFWEEAITFLLHGLVASGLPVSDLLKYVGTTRRKEA